MESPKVLGDTSQCLVELELEQTIDGVYMVSLIADTTWEFPNNVVSTAQITIKVPTGQFTIGAVTNLIENVIFFEIGTIEQPMEAPDFDYISIALGSQGTSRIPFQKGLKVPLFTISNAQTCADGLISLMGSDDDFYPPNMQDANVGQQLTVSGFSLADVPIAIKGEGINCNSDGGGTDNPELGVQIVQLAPSCNGALNGLIIAKANGGTPGYTYLWNTGDTTATIEGLGAGTYSLSVRDAIGNLASASIMLEETEPIVIDIAKTDVSAMGAMDGTATPTVSGGNPPYQFSWSNGSMDSLQTNLAAGAYMLTVTDGNDCEMLQSVMIQAADCPDIDVMLDMNAPSCVGDSTGSLGVSGLTGLAPYTYLWENGDTSNTLDSIPTGNYMVTITDANGCTMAVSALLPDADPIVIELVVMDGSGIGTSSINSTISGGQMPYIYAWSTGSDNNSISDLASGVYDLTITDANNCMQIASAIIDAQDCNLGILDEFGTMVNMDTISCLSQGEICLPVPLDSMIHYSLFLDGASFMEEITGCAFDTFYAYTYFNLPGGGSLGPYNLESWPINETTYSTQFETVQELVDSMNTWDPLGNWMLNAQFPIIQGGLPANRYGEMFIKTPITTSETTLDLNTNLTPKGTLVSFESGMHELILIRNSTTCADTLLINQPCTDVVNKDTLIVFNLPIGGLDSLNLAEIFGDDLQISQNTCPELSGENATIILEDNTQEVQIEALIEGSDDACFTIINADSVIINLTIRVNVVPEELNCESFIEMDTVKAEVMDCELFSICAPLNYDSLINYGITDNGVAYVGIASACDNGNGTLMNFSDPKVHEMIFTNRDNCRDTVIIAINAPACDEELVITDTIEVNDTGRSCIELAGLPGPFQSVKDLCPMTNGEMAMITIDGLTGCIDYTGIELGVDTACIEVCDVFGFCDTISVIITVTSGDLPPPIELEAVDDSTTTSIDDPVVLNALGNDTFVTLDDMYLVSQPDNGIAIFNLDGTIQYTPLTGFCNDTIPEMFDYAICNDGICDTATVSVLVNCISEKEFEIYTGLSPNGDGINDVFQIDGIEDFPNNVLRIFNRWGNQVYQMAGYKNEWDGTWGNNTELLPDGTYFYLFDDGVGKLHSGFLEIRR